MLPNPAAIPVSPASAVPTSAGVAGGTGSMTGSIARHRA